MNEQWIPCEVRPGPFEGERMVRITGADSTWVGFVRTDNLRLDPPDRPEVRVLVVSEDESGWQAIPCGDPISDRLVRVEAAERATKTKGGKR